MIIAIPLDGKDLEAAVCLSFGRAPYFLLYDSGLKEACFIDNEAAASQGGAGIKAAQSVIDNGAEALLAPRCGENAANVLSRSGIRIFKTRPGTARENIDAFLSGELVLLDEIHPGMHNHAK